MAAGSSGLLEKVLSNQGETMKQVLGRPIQDSRQQPSHAVVIARSAETIGSSEASCSFEVILTQPTFKLDTDALCQVDCALCQPHHCCFRVTATLSCTLACHADTALTVGLLAGHPNVVLRMQDFVKQDWQQATVHVFKFVC